MAGAQEHFFGGGVEQDDVLAFVHGDDRVHRRVEYAAQPCLAARLHVFQGAPVAAPPGARAGDDDVPEGGQNPGKTCCGNGLFVQLPARNRPDAGKGRSNTNPNSDRHHGGEQEIRNTAGGARAGD